MGCGGSKNEVSPPPAAGAGSGGASGAGAAAAPASNRIDPNSLPHTFNARYKKGQLLGEGAFSKVYLVTSKVTGEKFASKIVDRANLPKDDEEALKSEAQILKNLNHPNIVKCLDFFEEEKTYYMVLEYLEGGELFDRIVKKTFYNEKEARDLIAVILSAIKYMHDHDIVHRDLKPENLLLSSTNDDANVKIADFGFAIISARNSLTTQCGTPGYVAPEILESRPYGKHVDMWSAGVITYIILGGYPPFHDENQRNLFKKIKKAEFQFHKDYWDHVSVEAKDLISGLLVKDVHKRLTADQALKHPWLAKAASELASRNLETNLEQFRKYQATRKFRAAAKTIIAVNKMRHFAQAVKEANSEHEDSEKVASIQPPGKA